MRQAAFIIVKQQILNGVIMARLGFMLRAVRQPIPLC